MRINVRVRNKVNNRIREIENKYCQQFSTDILKYNMYGSQNKVWKMLNGLKKTTNENIGAKAVSEGNSVKYIEGPYGNSKAEEEKRGNIDRE